MDLQKWQMHLLCVKKENWNPKKNGWFRYTGRGHWMNKVTLYTAKRTSERSSVNIGKHPNAVRYVQGMRQQAECPFFYRQVVVATSMGFVAQNTNRCREKSCVKHLLGSEKLDHRDLSPQCHGHFESILQPARSPQNRRHASTQPCRAACPFPLPSPDRYF